MEFAAVDIIDAEVTPVRAEGHGLRRGCHPERG